MLKPRSPDHRVKHILRKFHYIREILERGDILTSKIDTDQNLADPFTKPMTQDKLSVLDWKTICFDLAFGCTNIQTVVPFEFTFDLLG